MVDAAGGAIEEGATYLSATEQNLNILKRVLHDMNAAGGK